MRKEKFQVKYGTTKVTVYPREGEVWALGWYELEKRKMTTCRGDEKTVRARAQEIAMKASRVNQGLAPALDVSQHEAEAVRRLQAIVGDRPLSLAVSDLEAGVAVAGSWEAAIKFLHSYSPDVAEVSIEGLYFRFMDRYDNKSAASAMNPRKELMAVTAAHPGITLKDITQEFLEKWLNRGRPAPLYFNTRLIVWRNFLSRCQDWGYIREGVKHVAQKIDKMPVDSVSPPILTITQMEQSLKVLEGAHLVGFAVGCFAGLRPSEIQRLEWKDISDDYIHVRAETSRKIKSERYVPMQPKLWAIIESLRAEGKVCSFAQWIKISRKLRAGDQPIIEKWPIDLLRHSYISYRLAETSNIAQVADEAGNSPDVIRSHYRRPLKKETGEKWFDPSSLS